ncbi:MAG: hypothetical protein R8M38_03740 [Mariprofundaceae bacterium]
MQKPDKKQAASFIQALHHHDLSTLKNIEKADLHCHSISGVRRERLGAWRKRRIPPPPATMRGLPGMMAYAKQMLVPYTNSRMGFEFTAEGAVLDAIEDGVTRLEISIDSRFIRFYTQQVSGLIKALERIYKRYHSTIDIQWEVGILRGDMLRETLGMQCISTHFFSGIDLYGDETCIESRSVQSCVKSAHQAGMKIKAHVGEFSNVDLIRSSVERLKLDAIQHGTSAAQSLEVMQWLAERQTPLNICPTSNVMLGSVASLADHPIKQLYEHGVHVTINSDDLLIFDQSVSEEYLALYQAQVLNAEALNEIREYGLSLS